MLTGLVTLIAAACSSGSPADMTDSLGIVSWNAQTMFDGKDDGTEYSDYRLESGWTEEKYRARLTALAGAVTGAVKDAAGGIPGILALVEVENARVIEDLAAMPGMDYAWTFFAAAPGSSLGVALMSRFPIIDAKTHSAYSEGNASPRPAAEVWVDVNGTKLALFICHWKSKLGGGRETELTRRAEASVVARRLAELDGGGEETPVVIMGDLNENWDEFFRTGYPCALMPDAEAAAALLKKRAPGVRPGFQDFLLLSGKRPPSGSDGFDGPALFSPWMDAPSGEELPEPAQEESSADSSPAGSFHYKDQWETIDHFLLNGAASSGTSWRFAEFRVMSGAPFTNAAGAPAAYIPRTGSGLSDHLPVYIRLEKL